MSHSTEGRYRHTVWVQTEAVERARTRYDASGRGRSSRLESVENPVGTTGIITHVVPRGDVRLLIVTCGVIPYRRESTP